MPSPVRSCLAIFAVALLLVPTAFAFRFPLSDESIREAYFLGQRHDGTYPNILGAYIKHLSSPKSGPYISSVTFLTPFIQLVEYSDSFIGNYSAQQALLDHRGHEEFVEIFVDIQLTDSSPGNHTLALFCTPDFSAIRFLAGLQGSDLWRNPTSVSFRGSWSLKLQLRRQQ